MVIQPPSSAVEMLLRVTAPPAVDSAPVTCGVPWPRGAVLAGATLVLRDDRDQPVPLQMRVLDRWPDGSARWVLLDFQAAAGAYRVRVAPAGGAGLPPQAVHAELDAGRAIVDTGVARFELGVGAAFPFRSVHVRGERAIDESRTGFAALDEQRRPCNAQIKQLEIEDAGPLRVALRARGGLAGEDGQMLADLDVVLHFFAGSAVVRFELTICNPRKAEHPGGLWDLGNGGAIYMRDASLTVALPEDHGAVHAYCSAEADSPFAEVALPLELYQDSSGGENWQSSNHMNCRRIVPNTFRGYRLRERAGERHGLRATPAVYLTRGDQTLGVAMPRFWQNFPKTVEASPDGSLVLRLFPQQYADVHEIQGGEQKTHTFAVMFGTGAGHVSYVPQNIGHAGNMPHNTLAWCRTPVRACANPEWYCSTGALPYLTPRSDDPNADYLRLVDAAIEGADTFDRKREVIDEFGWRHFGDVYGDHEAVFHKGPTPLVSHFNNQYDQIAGFAYQFFRSGDFRWLRHMEELAAHVIDVDLYHTDRDKSAYNHGLFWHTYHYVDADTGTHRSYPRAANVCGGGPANEQNYATGLMLHHFLTGSSAARDAAIALGRWVIDMDDGRKTPFRFLAAGPTGLASSSRTPDYHGPGRGAANSIAVLLDAHRLTGDARYLAKAEQLIRRCVHPADDVPARRLLDAENRWFYTMFLQSLGRYLDHKAELGQLDRMYAYAQASLLHYARWMAGHEYPYLDKPAILEYPTETWAAQDMRKSEVFKYAAKHALGDERKRFLERADFFFRDSVATLTRMPTRTLARPVVLLLSFGFMQAYFQRYPDTAAPRIEAPTDFGKPEVFVPQKVRAKKRFVQLAAAAVIAGLASLALLTAYIWR